MRTLRITFLAAAAASVLAGLFVLAGENYLLFHSWVELLAIGVAITIFSIGWNTRQFARNDMPNMDGEEAYRELRRINRDVPVILSSGYDPNEVARRFSGRGLAGFIRKPYTSRRLLSLVSEVAGG